MRVVQILYPGLGGHGSVALSLVAAAGTSGAWTSSLVFFGIEPVLSEYERACRDRQIAYARVQTRPGRAWLGWLPLYRMLERARPDAIILHSVKAILPCALYASRRRIPLLAVEHQANALKRASEWMISKLLMRYADAVVVLTPEYRWELQHRLGGDWRDNKVHVIPNGIDTDAYQPKPGRVSTGLRRVIGMASRLTRIKRHDLLVQAVAILCAQDGQEAWRLSLAGEGETLEALRTHVDTLKLTDVVTFPGYLGESALHDWFGGLDVYAHASSGETLSTSLLQALAMGLPVVGSDVPGIKSLLGSGGGVGLTVDQTPEAFANAIRQLVDDTELAAGLRTRARTLALEKFDQLGMFRKYQGILDRLCVG